ncbi:MAG: urate hydroxylase PuuD [Deltaproteobacteria bacterium]|nr:urate hydroxylase PuuD [Deltaproteobacteria bacterium]
MEMMFAVESIFRWFHIIAGIAWIGHLYFFNWVNAPMQAVIDAEAKKKVNPELLPRALFWFRWGAAWTWITGLLLLMMVFYHGGLMFDGGASWTAGAIIMVVATFLFAFFYDALIGVGALKDPKVLFVVGLIVVAVMNLLFIHVGGFSYRAFVIHTGAMFGTTMAFNVWFRIWPAQQKIITAVKEGTPPDAALVALAGTRSRHNTYMSIPLIWMMIDAHTTVPFASAGWIGVVVMVAIGWWLGTMFYRQSAKVKGF